MKGNNMIDMKSEEFSAIATEADSEEDLGEVNTGQSFTPEIPLPKTIAELPPGTNLSLIDRVGDVIFGSGQLFEDPVFNSYLSATGDKGAVTGKIQGDDWMLAQMVHEAGGFTESVNEIKIAMLRALKRKHVSRGERAPKAIEA
jgi:hypothetical protein